MPPTQTHRISIVSQFSGQKFQGEVSVELTLPRGSEGEPFQALSKLLRPLIPSRVPDLGQRPSSLCLHRPPAKGLLCLKPSPPVSSCISGPPSSPDLPQFHCEWAFPNKVTATYPGGLAFGRGGKPFNSLSPLWSPWGVRGGGHSRNVFMTQSPWPASGP